MFGLSPALLIAIGWGLTLVAGAGGTLWYENKYHSLVASDATAAAKAEQQILDAKAADAKQTLALAQQAEAIKNAVQEQIDAIPKVYAGVVSNKDCGGSQAARAFDSSLGLRSVASPQAPVNPARPAPAKPH